ncbi:MAG: hypothetical protein RLZZ364_602 [Actinomycetota bacterium]|jgi:hypothetical protein
MNSVLTFLQEAEIEVEGRLVDASNATLLVTMTLTSESKRAIYKPIAGERPLWDFQSGNLASRERAAYLIDQALEFNLIPTTILRDGPFGPGMVQEWIEIDESIDLELYFRQRSPELRKVALLDAVINNTDRKIGHLIPDIHGHLFICDHGVTFHEEDKLRTVLWQWSGEELAPQDVANLSHLRAVLLNEEIPELTSLISESEYQALVVRISRLIEDKRFPEPNPNWPAIPWPPF